MYLGFYTTGRGNRRWRSDGLFVILVNILDGGFIRRVDVPVQKTSETAVQKSHQVTRTQVAP